MRRRCGTFRRWRIGVNLRVTSTSSRILSYVKAKRNYASSAEMTACLGPLPGRHCKHPVISKPLVLSSSSLSRSCLSLDPNSARQRRRPCHFHETHGSNAEEDETRRDLSWRNQFCMTSFWMESDAKNGCRPSPSSLFCTIKSIFMITYKLYNPNVKVATLGV